MFEQLITIYGYILIISLAGFAGSSQSLFYDLAVDHTHWLTPQDFAAFLGFGFASPGPQLFSIATFIGYAGGGLSGAVVATFAIYLTPVILAILSGRYLSNFIHHKRAGNFLMAIGLSASGVLIAIGYKLFSVNTISLVYLIITVGAFLAIARWKINPLFIILTGGVIGGILLS